MPVKAYILIETQVGKTKDVVKAVHELEGVESVESVTGPYDAIAVVEAETLEAFGDLVTTKLGSISGISRTVTCIRIEAS